MTKQYTIRFEHGHSADIFSSYNFLKSKTSTNDRPLSYYVTRALSSTQERFFSDTGDVSANQVCVFLCFSVRQKTNIKKNYQYLPGCSSPPRMRWWWQGTTSVGQRPTAVGKPGSSRASGWTLIRKDACQDQRPLRVLVYRLALARLWPPPRDNFRLVTASAS